MTALSSKMVLSNNLVGGTTAGTIPVISANQIDGVQIDNVGTTNNLVSGDYIGTNASGTWPSASSAQACTSGPGQRTTRSVVRRL